MSPTRVLVVDDSALVRNLLSRGLAAQPDIEVLAAAKDAYEARDLIVDLEPDVITLDMEMPRMSGLEFIGVLMQYWPLPIIVISSFVENEVNLGLQALEAGAMAILSKPKTGFDFNFVELARLIQSVKGKKPRPRKVAAINSTLAVAPVEVVSQPLTPVHLLSKKVIVIGASTGGTEAIKEVLVRLPAGMPGIVMVQHMPPGFTRSFAERLDQLCPHLEVKEALHGDEVRPGLALLAPGDKQMYLKKNGNRYFVEVKKGKPVNRHMPSVEVIFNSAAETLRENAIGVILTGMGADGAKGLLNMRQAGARTLAQDEQSSVVFGMPREALANGGAERAVSLGAMAQAIVKLV